MQITINCSELWFTLCSVFDNPKSIKKHFLGHHVQSWRKFKEFSRTCTEFKDFSRTSPKIQGLIKTVWILVHWSEDHTSICSNPWSDPESEPLDDRRGLLEPWRKAVSVGSPARLTELIAWTLLGFKPNIFLVMVKSRLQKSSWTWNKTENTVIHCLNACTDTCIWLASPPALFEFSGSAKLHFYS